jgi:hypothetical protein
MTRSLVRHIFVLLVGAAVCLGISNAKVRPSFSLLTRAQRIAADIQPPSQKPVILICEDNMRDPHDFHQIPKRPSDEQPTDPRQQLRQIEADLRNTNLIFRRDIQILLKMANNTRERAILKSAVHRLEVALDAYEVQGTRAPDTFRPYGPECLLSQGNVLLLIQQDGVKWFVPVDSLLTGALVVGPQQSGKTRFLVNLCREIQAANPDIVITIIDPKNAFSYYASMLHARCVDLRFASFDLSPPEGVSEEDFVLEFIPPLSDTAGLVYGVEVITEGALIALSQLADYRRQTGLTSSLSLRDIYATLPLVKGTSSGRRQGYREGAETALHRILGGKGLFACRRGVSMEELFSTNTILGARSLTDDMQCRALALFLLYWEFQRYRYEPETNRLTHLIIYDDASRFFGTPGDQFGAASRTSPLAHVLALLRSTGTGLVVATQLPALLDPSLLALSRTMAAVGPTSGSQHLKIVSDFMHLNDDQAKAITRLSTREVVAFAPGTAYREPTHGWAPWVDDPPESALRAPILTAEDLGIEPWRHLADLPQRAASESADETEAHVAAPQPPSGEPAITTPMANASPEVQKLVYDCVYYPFDSVSARVKRLGLSGRSFEQAKRDACAGGWIIESPAGQTLYLIATEKAFGAFKMPCPYAGRRVSLPHSFHVSLTVFLLKKDGRYRSVQSEVPLGKEGATSDVLAIMRDGQLEAWEICLTTSHVLANITKYEKTTHRIVLLARTYELGMAIKGLVKGSGLDSELIARVEHLHVSQLLRRSRKLSQY